jgi:hypothetical protein
MSFQSATRDAPADADFVIYQSAGGAWTVVQRFSDGTFGTVANVGRHSISYWIAGVSANKKSLWNYETREFACGNIKQLGLVA